MICVCFLVKPALVGSAILGDISLIKSESSVFAVGRYDVLDRSTPADLGMSICPMRSLN